MAPRSKRRYTVHVLIIFTALFAYWFLASPAEFVKPEPVKDSIREKLRGLRSLLTDDLNREDLYQNGYMSLLVGWALLKSSGLNSVDRLLASTESEAPEFAAFYNHDGIGKVIDGFHSFDVNTGNEQYKIWKLVAPRGCKDTLPLFLNLKTGSHLCGNHTEQQVHNWQIGLNDPQRSNFLIDKPKTVKEWLRNVYASERTRL